MEEEAAIVRRIYQLYIDGCSFQRIADTLSAEGIKTPKGKDVWSVSTVQNILTNEKYKGDARLQKTFTVDFLSKEVRKNTGERKQWYIHDSHDAIISPEAFELVQREIERRCSRKGTFYDSPFSNKIICGDCGGYYGHRVWHSSDPYKKHIWRCGEKYHGSQVCRTPKFEDYEMERAFLKVANSLLVKKNNYVAEYEALFSPLIANTDALKSRLEVLQIEYSDILDQAEKLVHDNAIKSKDQEKYQADFNAMDAKIKAKVAEIETLEKEIADSCVRKENISIFLKALEGTDTLLTKFDSALWHRLVDYVTITPEGKLIFKLRSGQEMIVLLEEVH